MHLQPMGLQAVGQQQVGGAVAQLYTQRLVDIVGVTAQADLDFYVAADGRIQHQPGIARAGPDTPGLGIVESHQGGAWLSPRKGVRQRRAVPGLGQQPRLLALAAGFGAHGGVADVVAVTVDHLAGQFQPLQAARGYLLALRTQGAAIIPQRRGNAGDIVVLTQLLAHHFGRVAGVGDGPAGGPQVRHPVVGGVAEGLIGNGAVLPGEYRNHGTGSRPDSLVRRGKGQVYQALLRGVHGLIGGRFRHHLDFAKLLQQRQEALHDKVVTVISRAQAGGDVVAVQRAVDQEFHCSSNLAIVAAESSQL